MAAVPNESDGLLARAAQGDRQALGELLARHRERLHCLVRLRLDRRLQGRIDPSDVVQEAYLDATARLEEYFHNPGPSFFLWLRFLTAQKLVWLHRHHLGVQARDAGREVSLSRDPAPEASSEALVAQLLGRLTTPSQAAVEAELRVHVEKVLNAMDPLDREVLALRHFEMLSSSETAEVLGISPGTASKRYVRALKRLRETLSDLPGGLGVMGP